MVLKFFWTMMVELGLTDTRLFQWVEDQYYRCLVARRKPKKDDRTIVSNVIRCKHCRTLCESTHRKHLVFCRCKKVSASGGTSYLWRGGSREDYDELSEFSK